MSFENTVHGGAAPSLTTSVFYTGTSTLGEGYALCYDFNAYDINQENVALTSLNVGEEYWADARRICVEKCTEQNKEHFAGVVAAQSDGITGPGWVTIHRPGSVCNVYCYSALDSESPKSGTEGTGTACGELVNIVCNQWYMRAFGFPGQGAALVLQDVDRSTTAGLAMCELMTGQPSGGIHYIAGVLSIENGVACTTEQTLSNVLDYVPATCGAYVVTDTGSTMSSPQILSIYIDRADGRWVGQKVGFFNSTYISHCISFTFSIMCKANYSLYAHQAGPCTYEISAADEYLVLEFDGFNWNVKAGHGPIIS